MLLSASVWLVTTVTLVLVAVCGMAIYSHRISKSLKGIEDVSESSLEQIRTAIRDNLRPTIHVHDSRETVARRAAELLEAAASEEKDERRFVDFFGAASMSAQRKDDAGSEESEDRYVRAVKTATNHNVPMQRYVSLFTSDEIRERSSSIQQRYLSWLDNQQFHLANDALYRLINVPRAPKWGANMARVVSATTVLEITGNGRAAVVVEDKSAAKTIRQFATKAVFGGENSPTYYGRSVGEESVASFQEYRSKIKEAVASSQKNTSSS